MNSVEGRLRPSNKCLTVQILKCTLEKSKKVMRTENVAKNHIKDRTIMFKKQLNSAEPSFLLQKSYIF